MANNQVEYDYDYKGDSLFVYCVDSYEYDVSLELDNDVILDLDVGGKPVAFEFLNASKIFRLDKAYFKNLIGINIQSKITVDAINLNIQLTALIHNKNQSFDVNRIVSNLNKIPVTESIYINQNIFSFFIF